MPEFREILEEAKALTDNPDPHAKFTPVDATRQKYIKLLADYTKRDTILYSSKEGGPPNIVSVNNDDIHAFMAALAGLNGTELDLIINTNGGDPNAADAIMRYLRKKYNHIRAIVPLKAMSAGTIMACGCDEVVMGKHSYLGPIDPQFIMMTPMGARAVPAFSIEEQFKEAKKDISKNPDALKAWLPILNSLAPAMLFEARKSITFTREIVEEFLDKHMFRGEDGTKAKSISTHLADHSNFNSHGKKLDSDYMKMLGVKVVDLEAEQELQELVLSVFHATALCLEGTNAVKIIANNADRFLVRNWKQPPTRTQPAKLSAPRNKPSKPRKKSAKPNWKKK